MYGCRITKGYDMTKTEANKLAISFYRAGIVAAIYRHPSPVRMCTYIYEVRPANTIQAVRVSGLR